MKPRCRLSHSIFLTLLILSAVQQLQASPDSPITSQEQKVVETVSERIIRHAQSTLEATFTGAKHGATVGGALGVTLPASMGVLHGINEGPSDVAREATAYGVITALTCCVFITLGTGVGGGIGMAYGVIQAITEEGMRYIPVQILGNPLPTQLDELHTTDEL
ncbi:hypothetical protein [Endozoicomonas arenosclerae]|uniref:hypothetical protein n=1 Tax=Endozoicomonas arenosclerae TaxID=1633495 RepID=UPI0007864EFE|nr:hypothetical protein [Endozoicomonas arenosclerae]